MFSVWHPINLYSVHEVRFVPIAYMQQRATWNIRMAQRPSQPTLIFLQSNWKVKNLNHFATDVTSFYLHSDRWNLYINSPSLSFLVCCVILQRWHCHSNNINNRTQRLPDTGNTMLEGSVSVIQCMLKTQQKRTCVVVHHICDAKHAPLFLNFLCQVAHIHPSVVLARWREIRVQLQLISYGIAWSWCA